MRGVCETECATFARHLRHFFNKRTRGASTGAVRRIIGEVMTGQG